MSTISLCMIVRDEAQTLGRLLQVVKKHVDEIIIVDTGSVDETKGVAAKYTDKIFDYKWRNDFAAARNFSFKQGTCDYLMWFDGHDVVTDAFFVELKEVLKAEPDYVMAPYFTAFDENGNPMVNALRERVVRRTSKWKWEGIIHEVITADLDKAAYLQNPVYHSPVPKKEHYKPDYMKLIKKNALARPEDGRAWFYYGRELYLHNQFQECLEPFETCVKLSDWIDQKFWAQLYIGRAYHMMGKHQESFDAAMKSIAISPIWPDAYFLAGESCYWRQRWDEAIHWFLKARSYPEPGSGFIKDLRIYTYLSSQLYLPMCYAKLEEYESELTEAKIALMALPEDAMAKQNFDHSGFKVAHSDTIRKYGSHLVSVIIPTMDNLDHLSQTIETLEKNTKQALEIIVVNNGKPLSSKVLGKTNAIVYNMDENLGWVRGINFGLNKARGKYALMLNDDVKFFGDERWLTKMVKLMEKDPSIGAVGPASNCVAGFQNIYTPSYEVIEVPYLIGFCMLVRKEDMVKLEGLDKLLPGGDDLDLCIRLREIGKKSIADKSIFVWHYGFKTGERVYGLPSQSGGWNSKEMTEATNAHLLAKHGPNLFNSLWGAATEYAIL